MDLPIRAACAFFFILVLTRVVGRRELSTMEPFDVILLVVTGDLVQQGVTQSDYSLTGAAVVLTVMALLTVSTSYLSFRVPRIRGVLEGEPVILISDGDVIVRNLSRERITHEELAAEARQQQVGDFSNVRYAVLETSGKISFVMKQ